MSYYPLKEKMDSNQLSNDLLKNLIGKSQPVFLCVGSSRCVSDCLGPIVGELLIKKYNISAFVYGNMDTNVTVKNIDEFVSFIRKEHPLSPIVLIDSSVGNEDEVGMVKFCKGGVIPGGYTHQRTQILGDYSLTSIVTTTGTDQLIFLRSTTLKMVWKTSLFIADAISKFLNKAERPLF